MQIEPYADGWEIAYSPNEIQFSNGRVWPYSGTLGTINRRGTIRVDRPAGHAPREWGRVARRMLENARDQLWESGSLRNPQEERRQAEEARTGAFIVRLADGRQRRFHSMRSEFPSFKGARARPGAFDWILDELKTGSPTSYAEIFRGASPAIYLEPQIYPAREGFDRLIVGGHRQHSQIPIHTLMRTEYGSIASRMPRDVQRAYELKREAMKLVDDRWSNSYDVMPEQIASVWDVTNDAFEESNVPFQADYARANADYWWRRAGVSSRRRVNPPRRKRRS